MFFDVGGSMDWHIKTAEELFSAARTEFKHLEYFYFHNCLYEFVWKDNARRWTERTPTWQVLHKYPADYKVIFIGDASMSPYEISVRRRLGRAHERGAGRAVDEARHRHLRARRVAQPGAGDALGLDALDQDHARL